LPNRIKTMLPKPCAQCGNLFSPTVFPSGRSERPCDFRQRRFCCYECHNEYQRVTHNKPLPDPTPWEIRVRAVLIRRRWKYLP
jgi:hypothetical protein